MNEYRSLEGGNRICTADLACVQIKQITEIRLKFYHGNMFENEKCISIRL